MGMLTPVRGVGVIAVSPVSSGGLQLGAVVFSFQNHVGFPVQPGKGGKAPDYALVLPLPWARALGMGWELILQHSSRGAGLGEALSWSKGLSSVVFLSFQVVAPSGSR